MLIILMTGEISDFIKTIGTIGKQRAQKHSIIIAIIIIMLMIESVANYLGIKSSTQMEGERCCRSPVRYFISIRWMSSSNAQTRVQNHSCFCPQKGLMMDGEF